jgi:hypothetical protein
MGGIAEVEANLLVTVVEMVLNPPKSPFFKGGLWSEHHELVKGDLY